MKYIDNDIQKGIDYDYGKIRKSLKKKKVFVQDMDPACVLDQETILPYYGEKGGWHRIYTGKVVEAYTK